MPAAFLLHHWTISTLIKRFTAPKDHVSTSNRETRKTESVENARFPPVLFTVFEISESFPETPKKEGLIFQAVVNGDHQCTGPCLGSVVTGWKCPCCDVVSPTAASAQKHIDTHQGVRAFRCTICKYKGNTLRGMRTHIRMHFDKKNNDFQVSDFGVLPLYSLIPIS